MKNVQVDNKSEEIRDELGSLADQEDRLDELLLQLQQSRDVVLADVNNSQLYVPYTDIGQSGVADNNKILAVQHPLKTNKSSTDFMVRIVVY